MAHGSTARDDVRLRDFVPTDIPDLLAGCNDPLVARFLWSVPHPYTEAHARWWVENGAHTASRSGGWSAAIADPATGRLLGGAATSVVGAARGCAAIGYWVAPWARGRGVATAAARSMARWAFDHGFARLELTADPANVASLRVALAAGFSFECVRRGSGVDRAGQRHDQLVFARLPGDPAGPVHRLLPDLPGGPVPGGQLSDGVVTLRPVVAEDTDDIHQLRALPDMVASSVPAVPPGRAEVAHRCATSAAHWLIGTRAELTIRDAATGDFAGDIGLGQLEPPTGQAMIGYGMVPKWRGRGYATRAARLVAGWALTEVGLERLIAGTAPDNVGSQRVLQGAGFRREGYQRSRLPATPGSGRRIDDVLFALIRADWPVPEPANRPAGDNP